MKDTKHSGDAIVPIDSGNINCFLEHLLRLDPETRVQRFCHAATDAEVRDYVGRLDLQRAKIIGFVCEGEMRGAVELSPSGSARALLFDTTVSVEKDWQGRGIRTALVSRAIPVARGQGATHMRVHGLADDERLQRIVAQFDADILFEDGDCEAWLPVSRMRPTVAREQPAQAVHGLALPSG
jgi:GNAT superfamily N-acetyltransferase